MIWIWLAAMIVFMIIEAATMGLTSIWFALGALAALISAAVHAPIWLQAVWFIVVSGAALWLTRPLAKKYINARSVRTNADRVLGQTGTVTQRVDNRAPSGLVKTCGKVWTARSDSGEPIEEGAEVKVLRIEGVKLMVCPAETSPGRENEAAPEKP